MWRLWLVYATLASGHIRVLSPSSLEKVFAEGGARETPNGLIPASTATFGTPTYGESFVGRLLFINDTSCEADYAEELKSKYGLDPGHKRSGDAVRDVFLVPRGGCSFVKKVAVAEKMGADAVVIMDSPDSNWTRRQIVQVILSDDGNGQRVSIPSVLVEKEDGAALAAANFTVPPLINMEWDIPQTYLVRTDFWTSSGSQEANKFLSTMHPVVEKLKGLINFKTHYYVLRLHEDLKEDESVSNMCYKGNVDLCVPPPDLGSGSLTSLDVLDENLRQLCIMKLYSDPVQVDDPDYQGEVFFSSQWWQYIDRYWKECPLKVADQSKDHKFGTECSNNLMRQLNIDPSTVQNCVEEQGLALLEIERDNNAWGVMSLRVNGMRFSGNLEPSLVLKAMCSAFEKIPSQCEEAAKLLPDASATSQDGGGQPTVVHVSNHSFTHTLVLMFFMGAAVMGGVYLYQAYQARGMRNALRHEVMMEVKNQLQDWYRVEEPPLGMWNELGGSGNSQHGSARSLRETEFASLKFRT